MGEGTMLPFVGGGRMFKGFAILSKVMNCR